MMSLGGAESGVTCTRPKFPSRGWSTAALAVTHRSRQSVSNLQRTAFTFGGLIVNRSPIVTLIYQLPVLGLYWVGVHHTDWCVQRRLGSRTQ